MKIVIYKFIKQNWPHAFRWHKFMQFHKTHFSLRDNGNKRIIAYFDGSCLHGGLVDRLKGKSIT